MYYVLILAVFGTLAAGTYFLARRAQQRRLEAMRALAQRLGWAFQPYPPLEIVPGFDRVGLFAMGRRQEISNHLSTRRGDCDVAVFDFAFTTSNNNSKHVWRQTVVRVTSPGVPLPAFSLRPERALHRFAALFGYRDIDLESDPDFSRRYLLHGQDEAAVRALFGADVRDFYHRNPKVCTEVRDDTVFFWRADHKVPPEEVEAQVDLAMDLARRLRSAAGG